VATWSPAKQRISGSVLNQADTSNSGTGAHNNDGASRSGSVCNQSANIATKASAEKCGTDVRRSSSAYRKSATDELSRASKTVFRGLMSEMFFLHFSFLSHLNVLLFFLVISWVG